MGQAVLRAGYQARQAPPRGYKLLILATIAATFGLIVLGGIVRITGSGMGCGDDWPLCHGSLIPPFRMDVLIEYGHRLSASVVSVLIIALALASWRRRHSDARAYRLGMTAAGLVLVQVILGAITVKVELDWGAVVLHLGTAMLLFATLLVLATTQLRGGGTLQIKPSLRRMALGGTLGFYVLLLSGAAVASTGASWSCAEFPQCGPSLTPDSPALSHLHMTHRGLAILLGLHSIAITARAWREPRLRTAALSALALTLTQIGIGIAQVLLRLPQELRAAHLAVGAATWGALVVLTTLIREGTPGAAAAEERG